MDGEIRFKYFSGVVTRIYNRLGCINDVTNFNYRLGMLSQKQWSLIVKSAKNNIVCMVSFHLDDIFNLNNVLVECRDDFPDSLISISHFKCDFLFDPLAEDKVVRYLIDNHGKYFVIIL